MIRARAALLACTGVSIALSALSACAPRERPVTTLTIVADPGPFASVEEAASAEARVNWWDADPRDDDACTLAFAAMELRSFLPEAFGLPPSSVRVASETPDTGDVVVLAIESSVGPRNSAASESFQLRSTGRRGGRVVTITGHDRTGALYGAYDLLERLGVTFPSLGDTGIVRPRTPARWPRALNRTDGPAVPIRGFWAFEARGSREFFVWMARNRLNQWTAVDTAYVPSMKKLGFALTGGGHTIQAEFLAPARYFAAHPEWYGLQQGHRSADIRGEAGDNFCTSNLEARRQLARNLTQALVDGSLVHVDLVEVWMLDGGRWCECDACRVQGSPTDRVLDVAGDVAAAIDSARKARALRRPVTLSVLAYMETLRPPSRLHLGTNVPEMITFFPYFRCYAHTLDDPTCTEFNRHLAAAWRGWIEAAAVSPHLRLGLCEYYNVGAFRTLPLIFPHVMGRDLQSEQRAGRLARFEFMHAPTRAWGCWALNHWLFAQLAWNAAQDPDSLVERFCRMEFLEASTAMREHFRWLERASANILALQHCAGVYGTSAGGRLTQPGVPLFPFHHLQLREVHSAENDGPDLDEIEDAMKQARRALEEAKRLAQDPRARARIADNERRFAFGESMFALYAGLIRTVERDQAGDVAGRKTALANAARAAAALEQITDLVQVSASHANARDGLDASRVASTYEAFRRRYDR